MGERSGLVENYRVSFRDSFEKAPALDGDTVCTAFTHRVYHRNRHCKFQRAGKIHHKYRQRFGRVSCQKICQHRSAEAVRNELVGEVSCLALGFGFELFRLLDHLHNAVVFAATGSLVDADYNAAVLDYSPGVNVTSRLLVNRHCLACHGCLINFGFTVYDLAVERYHPACAHDYLAAR